MMVAEIPEIYRMMVDNCFLKQEELDRFLELYIRLPKRTSNGYEPLSLSEMGEFAWLQRSLLELRIEAGDEKAIIQKRDFEIKVRRMCEEQSPADIGFL